MFTGQKHKERFLNEIETLKQSHLYFNKKFLSALYTITSDDFLWETSKDFIKYNHIDFNHINIKGISVNSHQLWQFAKSITLGNEILLEDIIDKELYSDKNFKIIIDAIKIARKGLNLNCKLIGQDGNIFNLMAIASRTLRENGMKEEATEMCTRIRASDSYNSTLCIIGEYVNITGPDEDMCDEEDYTQSM